ncbi:hypothetical protein BGW42_007535 [Actinomortierella wolfii]|nr:hypothetical protein BGW42_007535 [Actinomortierella wolfii]
MSSPSFTSPSLRPAQARKASRAEAPVCPDTSVAEISSADLPSPPAQVARSSSDPPCSQRELAALNQDAAQDPNLSASSSSGVKNPILPPGGFPGHPSSASLEAAPSVSRSAIFTEIAAHRLHLDRLVEIQTGYHAEWEHVAELCRSTTVSAAAPLYQEQMLALEKSLRERVKELQADIEKHRYIVNTWIILTQVTPF